jgi:hypothetical protein
MHSDRGFLVPYLVYTVLVLVLITAPYFASAHEVYVLSPDTIAQDLAVTSPNPMEAMFTNKVQFFFWAFLGAVLVLSVFFASITHRLEEFFKPALMRLRQHAPLAVRLTLGVCFIACGYYAAFFGPELPFAAFGQYAPYLAAAFYAAGVAILAGVWLIPAASVALLLFGLTLWQWGLYPVITYPSYLGEILCIFLIASHAKKYEQQAFLVLRTLFGLSLIGAAVYAKFIHSELALDVVAQYHLTDYFPFEPLFIVLGAGIIEIVAGFFIMVGFEIRHTVLFLLFWLTLSLVYFQESVWPHLVIVGILIALFMYGYDKYTIEGRFLGRKHQPFL